MSLFDKLKSFIPNPIKQNAFDLANDSSDENKVDDSQVLKDFNELSKLISSKKSLVFNPLESKLDKAFSIIKSQLIDLHNSLDELAKTDFNEVEGHAKLVKAVQTSSKEVIAKINAVSIKLEPVNFKPLDQNFETVLSYSQNSLKLIQTETMQIMKSVTYTGFVLAEKIKDLGLKLKDLEQSFVDLNKFLAKQEKPKAFFELNITLIELKKLSEDIARIEKLLSARKSDLDALETKSAELKSKLLEFKNSSAVTDFVNEKNMLISLKKQIEDKKQELAISLTGIHSLLDALFKISSTNHFIVSKELLSFLQKFSVNVSDTLLENDSLLSQGVSEALNAINQGKLNIKEKQREKAIEILTNFDLSNIKPKILEIKQLAEKKSIIELKHENLDIEKKVAEEKTIFEKNLLQLDFQKKEVLDLEKNLALKKTKSIELNSLIKAKLSIIDSSSLPA